MLETKKRSWRMLAMMAALTLSLASLVFATGCQAANQDSEDGTTQDEEGTATVDVSELRDALSQNADVQSLESMDGIYQFDLDGAHYAIPESLSSFEDNGWELVGSSDSSLEGEHYYEIEMCKERNSIALTVLNEAESSRALKDCAIIGIQVDNEELVDVGFSTSRGLSLGDSAIKAAELYGGTGSAISESTALNSATWRFYKQLTDAERPQTTASILSTSLGTDSLEIGFDEESLQIDSIEMEYFITE